MIRDQQIVIDDIFELSPLEENDLPLLTIYANDEEVSNNTLTIPHPYAAADAKNSLSIQGRRQRNLAVRLAGP